MQRKIRLTPVRLLVLGYLSIILIGTVLLLLPFSTRSGESAPFMDALFTAVSASCVTGLIVRDTATYWSAFGHVVILFLIQMGGIGFMTVVFSFWKLGGKKIGLKERTFMQESVNAPSLAGMVRLTTTILLGTLICEGVGTLVLCFRFIPDLGWGQGIWTSLFLSVSAFCNAGFDILGAEYGEFCSLTAYSGDPIVCITIPLLIIIGGIGFFVWQDLKDNKLHFHRYTLHTKLVLITTGLLILIPWVLMIVAESGLPWQERILSTFFTAVSPRTAGFNVFPLDKGGLRLVTVFLTVVLMFIGGSSGSTAGGVKTNTLATLFLSLFSLLRGKRTVECFGRRIDEENVKNASQFVTIYLLFTIIGIILIAMFEQGNTVVPITLTDVVFEAVSAIGTVGLTLGITPYLSIGSEIVLIFLMFLGRCGCLTFLLALRTPSAPAALLPLEKIRIG